MVTDPPMHAEMFAVIRKRHRKYSLKDIESVAHVKGHHYHENFLKKHFPRWKVVPVNHPAVRFQAVNSGEADCFLVTSYRLNSLAEDFSRYKLTTIAIGVDMTLSFAVQRDNHQLYSILNKVRNLVPEASVYSALAAYSHEEKKVSFKDYVGDNLAVVIAFIASITAILLGLLLFGTKEQKKASERQQLISAAENDKVSGLFRNDSGFPERKRGHRQPGGSGPV